MTKLSNEIIEKFVFNLKKPAGYIGSELNQIVKENSFIKMGLCYPDLYDVGMSNNGIRILYDIANSIPDVSCERVFAVPEDFELKSRLEGIPLYTLETYTPLNELDILGFNLSYELLYTNVLQVLDLGRIPAHRINRDGSHPIVVAGGEAASNPAPLADFIDAFYLGDGEDGIIDIINAVRISKNESLSRKESLDLLSKIPGVYIPAGDDFIYDSSGKLININREPVKKRIYRGSELKDPVRPMIPNTRIIQERIVIEVTRGCKNLCNYCRAGYYELPYRHNDPKKLHNRISEILKNAHYSDLTLSSLTISDYKDLVELLNLTLPSLIENGISISLPSLKVEKTTIPVINKISELRKVSLTFAVESACAEIRNTANKKLRDEDILSIAEHFFESGWKVIKLYFMIGLPGCETYNEAEAIIELLKKIHSLGGRKKAINVTISPFVPKPHTPFQGEKQMDRDYFFSVIKKIKQNLPRAISIKEHNVNASLLEGILSRGDSKLGNVIFSAYKDGCRLDSWKENFNFNIWEKNLSAHIPDWEKYTRERRENDILPWSFIKTGYEKLISNQKRKASIKEKIAPIKPALPELNLKSINKAVEYFERKYIVNKKIRIIFSKTGKAKFYSHLDFIEIIKRALKMSGIPVSYTQGFNKRERLSLGFPTPIGIESLCELCDVDLYDDIIDKNIISILNAKAPEGIETLGIRKLEGKESIMSLTNASEYFVKINDFELYNNFLKNLTNKIVFKKATKKGEKEAAFDEAVIRCVQWPFNMDDNFLPANNGPFYDDYSSLSGRHETLLNANSFDERTFKLIISTGENNSIRIDNMIISLSETTYDELHKFKIIKTNQFNKKDNALAIIN